MKPETEVADPAAAASPAGIETKKRARKPRAPKVEKPKRERKPARTLAAWLRGKSAHHEEAAKILGAAFKVELRDAVNAKDKQERAVFRSTVTEKSHRTALENLKRANDFLTASDAVFARLDTLARQIAAAKGETVEIEVGEPNSGTDIDAAD